MCDDVRGQGEMSERAKEPRTAPARCGEKATRHCKSSGNIHEPVQRHVIKHAQKGPIPDHAVCLTLHKEIVCPFTTLRNIIAYDRPLLLRFLRFQPIQARIP